MRSENGEYVKPVDTDLDEYRNCVGEVLARLGCIWVELRI